MYYKSLCLIFIVGLEINFSSAFMGSHAIKCAKCKPIALTRKHFASRRQTHSESTLLKSNIKNDDISASQDYNNISISFPYAAAWIGFIAFALFGTASESLGGEASKELIDKFIQNPLNPGINHIFNYIFNLFAWIPFSLSALIMPGAKKQLLPATPFLLGSTMIGYMSLGT